MPSSPNLNLFTSNRLEILSVFLSEILKTPLSSPFTPEIVVVQSKGMERWISMEIAKYHGVCANFRFPFPNPFVYEDVFRNVLPDVPETSPFDRESMTWKIMGLLPELADRPGFSEIRHYLGSEENDLKRLQLSERIAYTFDQYLLYRPDMILNWQSGEEDGWQAVLWRKLVAGHESHHAPALRRRFFRRLEALKTSAAESLPERVAVFGVSTLPPFHMTVFEALSRVCEVNFFILNPCGEYWGDILSGREMRRIEKRAGDKDRRSLHLHQGNSLLAGMGGLGRDFFDRMEETDHLTSRADFFDPGVADGTILNCLQSDILNLQEADGAEDGRRLVDPADESIRVHSCHSPMREIEALHDHLLDLFERHPGLGPKDVLVMTPDIETYGPYVRAVFDRPRGDPHRIPFSIADRSYRSESRIIDTFLRLLDLWGGRYEATEVLAILETPAVRAAFDLTEPDLDRIREWVRETRIRWGIDADHRRRHGLPGYAENTWRAGLDRLLLGVALPSGGRKMFDSILPYDDLEGEETEILGRFVTYCRRFFDLVEGFHRRRSPGEWSDHLLKAAGDLFRTKEETEPEFRVLRENLRNLADSVTRAGFESAVDFPAIKAYLQSRLTDQGFGYGFITGGVTFCKTLPMRSIPFPVICMVGMNSDAYPRRDAAPGFDLIARNPRPGDRSVRNDDRYLFLESILSARQQLYISYVGQSMRDNSVIPPSVLVSELMDAIRKGFRLSGGDIIDDRVAVRHRLQAFSPAYFDPETDPRLFSYSEENCRTARQLISPRQEPTPFFRTELPDPSAERRSVNLDDLGRFLCNPARFLLNTRLGIYLGDGEAAMEETEPFGVTGLERYGLAQTLVEQAVHGPCDAQTVMSLERAAGRLPHGGVGRCVFEDLRRETGEFAEKTAGLLAADRLDSPPVDLVIEAFHLTGRVRDICPDRLIRYRYAALKAEDRLRIWIQHLALNAVGEAGYPRESLLIGLENGKWAAWEYGPVDNPIEHLDRLLSLYWKGLKRPLHFFPRCAWIYAEETLRNGKSPDEALGAAKDAWRPAYEGKWAEADEPHYHRCFGERDPLDDEFMALAVEVFGPLIAAERKESVVEAGEG